MRVGVNWQEFWLDQDILDQDNWPGQFSNFLLFLAKISTEYACLFLLSPTNFAREFYVIHPSPTEVYLPETAPIKFHNF